MKMPQSFCLAALLLTACSRETPPLPNETSWASELARSIDLPRLARPLESHERSSHFSSSATPDKTGLAHLAPEVLGDMDHGFFLRIEEHETFTDAVLAEASGPGMVSWIWSANPTGELLLYIDDPNTPAFTMPFKDFLRGKFLPVRYPFASVTANGFNLHFPVIHSNYLKMVLRVPDKKQLASFYYQIAWNALAAPVHPFNLEQFGQQKTFLRQTAGQLMNPGAPSGVTRQALIPPQQSVEIFRAEQNGLLEYLQLEAPVKSDLSALKIQAFWDSNVQPSIDCPLHLFAGVSPDFENVVSFPVTVKDARLSIRWPMPFGAGSRIVLKNSGTKEVPLNIRIAVSEDTSPALRLHTQHACFKDLQTDAPNVLTLADISGSGRIAGCVINVRSRTNQWWGEGDQIIWLDDRNKPAWRGTSTEDYFGFAWCSTKEFSHPFRGQPRVLRYADYRISTMHRYHLLDTLPFHTAAQFQTEAWGLAPGTMDYESLIIYYLAD